jgi:hypothetical protein
VYSVHVYRVVERCIYTENNHRNRVLSYFDCESKCQILYHNFIYEYHLYLNFDLINTMINNVYTRKVLQYISNCDNIFTIKQNIYQMDCG